MKKTLKLIVLLTVLLSFNNGIVFAQLISPGKLTGSHLKLEGLANCVKCHQLGKGVLDSSCLSCHEKLAERLKSNKGFHATVKGKCIECHTDHKGESFNIINLDTEKFDHKQAGYELKDKHKVTCGKCHKKEKTYLGLSTTCLGCHADVHKKALPEDCLKCHNFTGWKEVTFEHDKYADFKLTGKHNQVKCEQCHPRYSVKGEGKAGETESVYSVLKFKPLKHDKCSDCHSDIHKGELKEKTCENCHTPEGWEKKTFEHNNPRYSDFKVQGRHEKVSCVLCHPEEKTVYKQNGQTAERLVRKLKPLKHDSCNDCHYDVHQGQFKDKRCDSCHTVENEWRKNTFNHGSEQYKGFKIEGKHKTVECEKCHVRSEIKFKEFTKEKKASPGKFKPLKSETCSDCHYDVHQGQFKDKRCDSCHTVENEWKKHTFDHGSQQYKGFRLEGKHKAVECEKCHVRSEIKFAEFTKEKKASPGRFKPLKSESCSDCHKDEHKGQYKQECGKCHNPDSWEPGKFLHDPQSFEMKGAHRTLSCEYCHKETETFKGLSPACISCHQEPHLNQFGQFCTDCHKQETWIPLNFKHAGIGFRLVGNHRAADCSDCHKNRDYRNTPSECFACHQSDYRSATMHLTAGFSYDCTECHRISGTWQQATYRHKTFIFTGPHSALKRDCLACHGIPGGIPPGTTNQDCYTCHAADYQSAPDHIAFDFGYSCTDCHSPNTWEME